MKLFIRKVYSIYAFFMFVLIMLIIFPFIILCSLTGKIRGGNLIYKCCNIWARTWYFFIGIRHEEIFESAHDYNKQFIFIANHISYMDIPPVVATIKQPYRVLGKAEMVKIPIFGFIYKLAVVLVDRSSSEKRAQSLRALKAAIAHHISIFIFPEGTFNLTKNPLKEFYDGAFKIAIETQTPIKPILFIDSFDRLHHSSIFTLNSGKNRVVYLQEIEVAGLSLNDVNFLKQKAYKIMEDRLKHYRSYASE